MRYYTFTHFMLSSIQQGIQPAHCVHETFIKYSDESVQRAALLDWAANHKTMICLNGGNSAGLREVYEALTRFGDALSLPYCKFHEDEQSLDGVMTCCGLVVPEYIYSACQYINGGNEEIDVGLNEVEYELAAFLKQFGLAK